MLIHSHATFQEKTTGATTNDTGAPKCTHRRLVIHARNQSLATSFSHALGSPAPAVRSGVEERSRRSQRSRASTGPDDPDLGRRRRHRRRWAARRRSRPWKAAKSDREELDPRVYCKCAPIRSIIYMVIEKEHINVVYRKYGMRELLFKLRKMSRSSSVFNFCRGNDLEMNPGKVLVDMSSQIFTRVHQSTRPKSGAPAMAAELMHCQT